MSFESMTLAEMQENAKRMAEMQAKMQEHATLIASLVKVNKSAMMALCSTPAFLEACRGRLPFVSGMSDKEAIEAIRSRLMSDEDKKAGTAFDWSSVKRDRGGYVPASSAEFAQQEQQRKSKNVSHTLELDKCGRLSGVGYAEKEKDKHTYVWVTLSEYLEMWQKAFDAPGKMDWLGVYSVSVTGKDGAVNEYIRSKFRGMSFRTGSICQAYGNSVSAVEAWHISGIFLYSIFMRVLYDMFGDEYCQKMYELMVSSRQMDAGNYRVILAAGSELSRGGAKLNDSYRYIALPGVFRVDGIVDSLYLSNAALQELRDRLGVSEVYSLFNEKFYIDSFRMIACALSDNGTSDEVKKEVEDKLDANIKLYIRKD